MINEELKTVEQQWEEFYNDSVVNIFPENELKEFLKLIFFRGYITSHIATHDAGKQLGSPALRIAYWKQRERECFDYLYLRFPEWVANRGFRNVDNKQND